MRWCFYIKYLNRLIYKHCKFFHVLFNMDVQRLGLLSSFYTRRCCFTRRGDQGLVRITLGMYPTRVQELRLHDNYKQECFYNLHENKIYKCLFLFGSVCYPRDYNVWFHCNSFFIWAFLSFQTTRQSVSIWSFAIVSDPPDRTWFYPILSSQSWSNFSTWSLRSPEITGTILYDYMETRL